MHEQMDAMHGQQVRAALAIEQGAQAMQQLQAAAGVLDGKLSESLANEVWERRLNVSPCYGCCSKTLSCDLARPRLFATFGACCDHHGAWVLAVTDAIQIRRSLLNTSHLSFSLV